MFLYVLQYGSHSKKRPDNIVIGRTFDHHIYDLVELGIENFKSMQSFSYDKKLTPRVGSKPLIVFIGEGFEKGTEGVEELKHLKEILLDLLRGEVFLDLFLFFSYICLGLDELKVWVDLLSAGCGDFKSCWYRSCLCCYGLIFEQGVLYPLCFEAEKIWY